MNNNMNEAKTKVCSKCKEEMLLTREFFYRDKHSQSGFRSDCKRCSNERKKVYYNTNKECVLERNKTYRDENKELMSEINKKYYNENKKQLLESQKEYYDKNKDKIIDYQRSYYKENIDYVLSRQARYYEENKAERLDYGKDYYEKNKERIQEYKEENKGHFREYQRRYMKENPHIFRQARQRREALRKKLPHTLSVEQWDGIKIHFNNSCAYCGMTEKEHIKEFNETLHQEHFIPLSRGGGYTHNNIIPACRSCNSSKHDNNFFEWYPTYKHYCEKRKNAILKFLGYKDKVQQLSIL